VLGRKPASPGGQGVLKPNARAALLRRRSRVPTASAWSTRPACSTQQSGIRSPVLRVKRQPMLSARGIHGVVRNKAVRRIMSGLGRDTLPDPQPGRVTIKPDLVGQVVDREPVRCAIGGTDRDDMVATLTADERHRGRSGNRTDAAARAALSRAVLPAPAGHLTRPLRKTSVGLQLQPGSDGVWRRHERIDTKMPPCPREAGRLPWRFHFPEREG
jgi:hypothetical protein